MHTIKYMENKNNVIEFILQGLTENPKKQKIIFIGFLVIYIVFVVANVLIVVTITASSLSESPMYYFLAYLSFIDACYSSDFSYCSWGSQGKNTEVVCHSLLQWTTFCQTSPTYPIHLGRPYMAWLSFIELDKAAVYVIKLASCL